jgi:uncharacterized protein YraI
MPLGQRPVALRKCVRGFALIRTNSGIVEQVRRFLGGTFLLLALCLNASPPSEAAFRRGVALVTSSDGFISVRSSPRASARLLTTFESGDPISIDWARKSGTWYFVRVNGIQGWSNTRYFSTEPADGMSARGSSEDLRELPAPDNWIEVARGGDFVVYLPLDRSSEPATRPSTFITWQLERPKSGMIRNWRHRYEQRSANGSEELLEIAIDCSTRSEAITGEKVIRDFDSNTIYRAMRVNEYRWQFSRVIPGSVGEAVLDGFCNSR